MGSYNGLSITYTTILLIKCACTAGASVSSRRGRLDAMDLSASLSGVPLRTLPMGITC